MCFMLALVMLIPTLSASAVNFKPIESIDEKGKPVELKLYSKACCVMDIESGDNIFETQCR